MNAVVASLWEQLNRYENDQRRFLQACVGRETDTVIPFAGHTTTVRAAPWSPCAPEGSVRIAYVAADGCEHGEAVLERADLLALGIGPWILRHASVELLADVLATLLASSLQRVGRLLRSDVALCAERLGPHAPPPERPWASFVAEAVPRLGSLRFRLSCELVQACESQPMPRRGPGGMRHIPLLWDVRIGCLGLERHVWQGVARGDVVNVLLSPLRQAEVVGALLPHHDGLSMPQAATRARRRVKVLVDDGGWINLRFTQAQQGEYTMEDQDVLDGPIVPIHLTLPVAAMSLHEIDAAKPGTLVDTGVRLEEVEVGLWSAGYRFATGRLVVIGEHLGVEIARTERDLP